MRLFTPFHDIAMLIILLDSPSLGAYVILEVLSYGETIEQHHELMSYGSQRSVLLQLFGHSMVAMIVLFAVCRVNNNVTLAYRCPKVFLYYSFSSLPRRF